MRRSLVVALLAMVLVGCRPVTPLALEASPNPVPTSGGRGTTTITWSTGERATGQVFVSEATGPETLFAAGRDGSQPVTWIKSGVSYTFTLYAGTEHATALATVAVTGQ